MRSGCGTLLGLRLEPSQNEVARSLYVSLHLKLSGCCITGPDGFEDLCVITDHRLGVDNAAIPIERPDPQVCLKLEQAGGDKFVAAVTGDGLMEKGIRLHEPDEVFTLHAASGRRNTIDRLFQCGDRLVGAVLRGQRSGFGLKQQTHIVEVGIVLEDEGRGGLVAPRAELLHKAIAFQF